MLNKNDWPLVLFGILGMVLVATLERARCRRVERLPQIADNSGKPKQQYPSRLKVLFVAVAFVPMALGLLAIFAMPREVRWLWPWVEGPLFLLWLAAGYSCRCLNAGSLY